MSFQPHEHTLLLHRADKPEDVPQHAQHAVDAQTQEARTLLTACTLTFFFFIVELIGGYVAGSVAIMADAAHLLSDLAGFLISVTAIFVARLPANAKMSFGFARAEVLGAFISILFIWSLTAALVAFAVYRFFNPEPVNGRLMLALGCIGLAVNLALGLVLGGDTDDLQADNPIGVDHHSADIADVEAQTYSAITDTSSHQDQHNGFIQSILFGGNSSSVILQAAYLHILGDALQNVGVIFAAVILIIRPKWTFVDPICTLFFAAIVITTTKNLAKQTFHVLMEGTPPSIALDDIYNHLRLIDGVSRVGDLHVWSITTKQHALSVHLYKKSDAISNQVLKYANDLLQTRFNILHTTVQINCEPSDYCDEKQPSGTSSPQNCMSYDGS